MLKQKMIRQIMRLKQISLNIQISCVLRMLIIGSKVSYTDIRMMKSQANHTCCVTGSKNDKHKNKKYVIQPALQVFLYVGWPDRDVGVVHPCARHRWS